MTVVVIFAWSLIPFAEYLLIFWLSRRFSQICTWSLNLCALKFCFGRLVENFISLKLLIERVCVQVYSTRKKSQVHFLTKKQHENLHKSNWKISKNFSKNCSLKIFLDSKQVCNWLLIHDLKLNKNFELNKISKQNLNFTKFFWHVFFWRKFATKILNCKKKLKKKLLYILKRVSRTIWNSYWKNLKKKLN